jgi:uncharacterized protein (DUF1501 family)
MYLLRPQLHTRRAFLRRSGQLALAGSALPTAINLASIGEAAAEGAPAGSYKALVCVFLYGGNDHSNTVVSYDSASYKAYQSIRNDIALARADLAKTVLTPAAAHALPDGKQFALHPQMAGLAGLFNQGHAAIQMNVGPLVVPMIKRDYEGSDRVKFPLPPKLFSHNDQQSIWQSSSPEGSTIGWGGNIADLALSSNGSGSLFTCVSVTGNAVFLAGDNALAYQVSTNGAVKIKSVTEDYPYGSEHLKEAMLAITQQQRPHMLENEYNIVTRRSIGSESVVTAAVSTADSDGDGPAYAAFDEDMLRANPLAKQLKMVARMIAGRKGLGTKRQVFMVSLGGFDLHDSLLAKQPDLLKKVSEAITAFYQTTQGLAVANDVTTFTASDFGRTLSSNGDGSDHGWGSHHFIVGGAVQGSRYYGVVPPVGAGKTDSDIDQWHVGNGRLLPTTSVDQYAATLASWFGVPANQLQTILPNLNRFGGSLATGNGDFKYPVNMGYFKSAVA